MAARELRLPAAREEVVRRAALALRRLGARIVRYDAEEGSLEARCGRRLLPETVRLRAVSQGEGAVHVVIETGGIDWRALVRRLAAELEAADWR